MGDSRSRQPSRSPAHQYFSAVDESKQLIFTGSGNLNGYMIENDSASDVYAAFYDAADPADVTVGTTPPAFTQKIAALSQFGRDSNGDGYKWFSLGCVVAVVSSRNGAGAPAAPAVVEAWSSHK